MDKNGYLPIHIQLHFKRDIIVNANLFDPVQKEVRPEEILQKGYVKQISTYGIMLGYWVPELHNFIVGRPINSLIIKEMG